MPAAMLAATDPVFAVHAGGKLIVDIVSAIAPGFGGINLEGISAPRCFEVEGKLRQRLRIPAFHDDQHGAAVVVVLAALHNAVKLVDKQVGPGLRVVVQGIGAAGIAVSNPLLRAGVVDLVRVDRHGVVTPRRRAARDVLPRPVPRAARRAGALGGRHGEAGRSAGDRGDRDPPAAGSRPRHPLTVRPDRGPRGGGAVAVADPEPGDSDLAPPALEGLSNREVSR